MIILTLAAGPPAGMLWVQRRRPSARKPHQWPWRALAVAVPQAMALGFAVNAVLDEDALAPLQRILLVLAVALIPAVTAELARRSLLRQLVAELGAGDFELLVEPRTGQRSWFYSDSIALTDREILISVRSGSGRATWDPKTERIALADVTAVGTRPVLPSDSPWITLSDGRGLSVAPGDVVVIQCREAVSVLPVDDAAVFAEVIRARASRVRGAPVGALPIEAGAPLPAGPGHVPEVLPEVLPAPEPSGPVAHPVTGPVAAPRTGPGMTVRCGLGFPLALLGIVGVPAAFLGTSLFSESIARGAEFGSGAVVAGAALAIAAALVADWVRVCRRLRVAQDNALPPASPDWDDLRPDHAPLEGWQPWWEGPDQMSRVDSSEAAPRQPAS